KVSPPLACRGARDGLGARLPTEVDRLRPALALLSVVRQALDVLGQAVAIHRADAVDDSPVKVTATILEEASVGHLVGQRVLERVLEIGKETAVDRKRVV